ncbi:hypothetical protein XM38_050850 [Halomicronema hongdechloris C2206]|uniref:Uncharacterized protein n=1 Tax=Halomicronema hongdechloris C2206 TaxID=1641165 RepID=A0A1Z3HUW9_9CYAN|nr:hypothetical protein [Halomicronema hongdechloris]ASC74110.1 hypothetical protein XM38_050850 [Halomicronema hongdechloris C2206]
MHQTIDEFITAVQVAIDNALANSTLQAALSDFGYTPERLAQGRSLHASALVAHLQQRAEYGDQASATAALQQTRDTAEKSYMRLVKIARIAYKDNPGALVRLDLNGKRKRSLSGWLLQAQQFYSNLLAAPDLLDSLKQYGVTAQKVKAAQAELAAVAAANLAQEQEKGQAQTATQVRDTALDALSDWFSDFIAIARIALEDEPQMLEAMGVMEPS